MDGRMNGESFVKEVLLSEIEGPNRGGAWLEGEKRESLDEKTWRFFCRGNLGVSFREGTKYHTDQRVISVYFDYGIISVYFHTSAQFTSMMSTSISTYFE